MINNTIYLDIQGLQESYRVMRMCINSPFLARSLLHNEVMLTIGLLVKETLWRASGSETMGYHKSNGVVGVTEE